MIQTTSEALVKSFKLGMVIIMQGIPGSGKTELARKMAFKVEDEDIGVGIIVSADKFFQRNGQYEYDPARIGEAHRSCMAAFLANLRSSQKKVGIIVDNTNTSILDVAPYYRAAEATGWKVYIVWTNCLVGEAMKRQIHGVPVEVVVRMDIQINEFYRSCPENWNVYRVETGGTR